MLVHWDFKKKYYELDLFLKILKDEPLLIIGCPPCHNG